MPFSHRWLWTFVLLLTVGCQSTPTGSRALLDLARAEDERTSSENADAISLVSDTTSSKDASESVWSDDPVLVEVVERELADASPERRRQWLERIASLDPDDIPHLLSERRRLIREGGIDDNTVISSEETAVEPSNSFIGHERRRVRSHPKRGADSPLQAPSPPSTSDIDQELERTALVDGTPSAAEQPEEETGFIDSMFDVFGVSGDRKAATAAIQETTEIRRAGFDGDKSRTPSRESRTDVKTNRAEPSRSLQSVYWQEELDKLVALLETQLAQQEMGESQLEQDHYLRQHVALKLLYLIGSRRPEALQAIPHDDPAQQEFWTEMMWALSNVFDDDALPDPSDRARETVERLRTAIEHLAPKAGLDVTHTVFSRQIDGFGNYTLFEKDEFSPGQSVLVYAEADNFGVQVTTQGDYVTRLQSTLDIHEGSVTGPVVFHNELAPTEDLCRSRRRDYFHSYRIKLPTTLKPGPHVLTLSIRDEVSHKVGTTTLNFLVR